MSQMCIIITQSYTNVDESKGMMNWINHRFCHIIHFMICNQLGIDGLLSSCERMQFPNNCSDMQKVVVINNACAMSGMHDLGSVSSCEQMLVDRLLPEDYSDTKTIKYLTKYASCTFSWITLISACLSSLPKFIPVVAATKDMQCGQHHLNARSLGIVVMQGELCLSVPMVRRQQLQPQLRSPIFAS